MTTIRKNRSWVMSSALAMSLAAPAFGLALATANASTTAAAPADDALVSKVGRTYESPGKMQETTVVSTTISPGSWVLSFHTVASNYTGVTDAMWCQLWAGDQ